MLCDNCGKNEATVMYSENINGVKKEMHLCQKCSKELGIDNINFNMPIDFSSFFGEMLEDFQTPEFMPLYNSMKDLKCKNCGYTFDNIVNKGQFGCANCYETFQNEIDPIIKKIQGANMHIGRIGKISDNKIEKLNLEDKESKELNKIDQIKAKLKEAIKTEDYEKAAKLRDEIKKLENED